MGLGLNFGSTTDCVTLDMLLNLSINLENDIYYIGLLSSVEIKYMKLHSTYRHSVHIDSYFFRQRWKGMELGTALGKRS